MAGLAAAYNEGVNLRLLILMSLLPAMAMAQNKPDPPPPKNPIFTNPPRGPSAWDRIQDPVDRSTGRIVDDSTYQIERMQRQRDEDHRRAIPQTEYQRFEEERERALRIENRERVVISQERARREELDRREYEVRLKAGYPSASAQATADDQALRMARGKRDEQLITVQNERAESLRNQPDNRQQIEATFQQRTSAIRAEYDKERGRILGVDAAAPPASQPANP